MKHTHTMLAALMGLAALAGLGGCRGQREDAPPRQFFPDLDDQPKWKPQTGSEFFADGRTMRQPVANTIAFGRSATVSDAAWAKGLASDRAKWVERNEAVQDGTAGFDKSGNPVYVKSIPASIEVTEAMLRDGQRLYGIYCSACHGHAGDGGRQALVGKQYSPEPPSFGDPTFADPKNVRALDGWLFHTIRRGKPKTDGSGGFTMPPYGHALDARESWAVVAYVRALQESRRGTIDDVPAELRDGLMRRRPPATGGGQ
jgi:mono/diheme cytochrome c family protein